MTNKKSKSSKASSNSEQSTVSNSSETESVAKDVSGEMGPKKETKEPKALDTANSTAPVDPIADEQADIKAQKENGTNSTDDS